MDNVHENRKLDELRVRVTEARKRISSLGEPALSEPLDELSERLADPRRFVAVFGAFSAGKSSLINALLGQHVLSVSPHPTTAVITEVEATATGEGHLKVWTKSSEEMWEDVSRALQYLHLEAGDLETGLRKGAQLKSADFPAGSRRHVSFLRAAAEGYEQMSNKLGQVLEYSRSELETLTANESIACYLHRVSLMVPVRDLADGVVLVDTPGVDSIHRRHTDVAFDYMRHAEAVIFVLYYTHAFTRSDEAFLSQLSDVQNIVGVNKLFVVINAVDLATSDEEQLAVRQRVESELRRLGIAQPRVYEVSSQTAIAARRLAEGDTNEGLVDVLRQRLHLSEEEALPNLSDVLAESGVRAVTDDLQAYLDTQATQLAYSTALSQYKALHHSLAGRTLALKQRLEDSAEQRKHRESQRHQLADQLEQLATTGDVSGYEQEESLEAQWRELAFHIGERIRLSMSGTFRAAFHPGLFRMRGNTRRVLQQAAAEFVEDINRRIEAEVRTFAMRMDVQVQEVLERSYTTLLSQLAQVQAGYIDVAAPELGENADLPSRANLDADLLQPFFRHFSNPRQFFEEGGQKEMLSDATPKVMESVSMVLQSLTEALEGLRIGRLRQLLGETYHLAALKLRELTEDSLSNPETLIQYSETLAWLEEELGFIANSGWQ